MQPPTPEVTQFLDNKQKIIDNLINLLISLVKVCKFWKKLAILMERPVSIQLFRIKMN